MKRKLSLLLAVVMILSSFSFVFADEDFNVPAFLKKNGILVGNDDGDLMLDENLLRKDSVVLFARLLGKEAEAESFEMEGYPTFTDLAGNPYYDAFLAWAEYNEYFVGRPDGSFGYNDNLEAIESAIVLLRALGYTEEAADWDNAWETAKKLGLLKDIEVERRDLILREDVAQMIFNALGVEMKEEGITLAEFLGIELPEEPKPEELEVVDVYAENLKEVVVEVSNAELLDEEDVKKVDNYRLVGNKVEKVTIEEDSIILLLANKMNNNRKYELVIRNMNRTNRALNGTYTFEAKDNVAPVVLGAQYLGKYGIKVTMSEPIESAPARNFRILEDGKDRNIVMDVAIYDREIILTPYGKEEFDIEKHDELTVKYVVDYAGIRSTETTVAIEEPVEGYDEAPEVVEVKAYGNKLEVRFDKEIRKTSVKHYVNSKNTGNVEYLVRGRHAAYANNSYLVDPYTAVYEFNRTLSDRFTEVAISGVENHEGKAMDKVTLDIEVILDRSEPVVVKTDVIDKGSGNVTVILEFDRPVVGIVKGDEDVIDKDKHFLLYETGLGKFKDQEVSDEKIKEAKLSPDGKTLTVELKGLRAKDEDGNKIYYILETFRFEDKVTRVPMFIEYTEIDLTSASETLTLLDVKTIFEDEDAKFKIIEEIRFEFEQKLDRLAAEDTRNYVFTDKNDNVEYLDDLGGYVELDDNGRRLNIVFPEGIYKDKYATLEILKGLRGLNGEVLDRTMVYDFDTEGVATAIRTTNSYVKSIGNGEYEVVATGQYEEVEITTKLYATIKVIGDIDKLTVNAPNAHIVIADGVTIEEVEILAIGSDSLEINGIVEKLVISTNKVVKVFGNVKDMVVATTVDKAKVKVAFKTTDGGVGDFVEFELKEGDEFKIEKDKNGKPFRGETEEQELESAKDKLSEVIEEAEEVLEKAEKILDEVNEEEVKELSEAIEELDKAINAAKVAVYEAKDIKEVNGAKNELEKAMEAVNDLLEEKVAAALKAVNDAQSHTELQNIIEEHAKTLGLAIDDEEGYAKLIPGRKRSVSYDLLNNKPTDGYTLEQLQEIFDDIVATRLVTQASADLFEKGDLEDLTYVQMLIDRFNEIDNPIYKRHSGHNIKVRAAYLERLVAQFEALDEEGKKAVLDYLNNKEINRSQDSIDLLEEALEMVLGD